MNRRNLLMLGGGAVVGSLLGPSAANADPAKAGRVKIKDVQSATIMDEYPCNLIKVTTDSDLYGLGEARPKIQVSRLLNKYKKLITGEDPLRVDYLWRRMMTASDRPKKEEIGVISGIETALWDLAGKILNTPAYTLMGGKCHENVPVYYDLSPIDTPKTTDPKPWVAWARHARKAGFKAMKIDVNRNGGSVPEWVKILEAIRADLGPDMKIGVDFHWGLDPAQTDKFIERVEPVGLWFVEDPMKYNQKTLPHYQQLASKGEMPIVGCEQMVTRKGFHSLIEKRMCTIIEPDGQYCGGLSELKRIAELGELYGMKMLCHNMCTPVGTFAQAHACLTIHSCVALESAIAEQVIRHDGPMVEDGHLKLNDKPGFGIELNEDYCRKHLSKGSSFFGE
jgi:L-alanine-DL-glutamate epimerase-like enolase superfamily enzyme